MVTMLKLLSPRAGIARFSAQIAKFGSNRRGNVAVITALACLPMVAAVGCVIDYSDASMIKTKLQAASDAAALATVSVNSSVIATAKAMSSNGTVSGGSTYATNFFNSNLNSAPENVGYNSLSLTPAPTVTLSGTTVTVKVNFSANVPTYFLGVLGHSTITVNGSSTASYALPTYINFYLMTDVSGSMSMPSTAAEQARLMAVNPDDLQGNPGYPQGCQFACHFSAQGACAQTSAQGNPYQGPIPAAGKPTNLGSGGYCQGFIISRLGTNPVSFSSGNNTTNGNSVNWNNTAVQSCPTAGTTSCIQLRADAVGYAVTNLLSTAHTVETNNKVTGEYQVGLFPFIQYLYGCASVTPCSASNTYFPLTTNLTGTGTGSLSNAANNLATLLDTGVNSNLGSGGTHFENAFASINSAISSVGTGTSSSNALPYIFLITDGSQNYQTQWTGNWGSANGTGSWSATTNIPYQNSASVIPKYSPNDEPGSTDWCTKIKNRGITIAVLYIPYQTISDASTIFDDEDGYANSNIQYIPTALQACASTNFFYTASTPADINSALQTMFNQAVDTAHITN
jgi:Flp pilus assembly protein TadG